MSANGFKKAPPGFTLDQWEQFNRDGYLIFVYVYTRFERHRLVSPTRVDKGVLRLGLSFTKTGEDSAAVAMQLDDETVASTELPRMWQIFSPNSGIRCGENRHAPVSREYEGPFVFDQQLKRVVVTLAL